MAKAISSEQIDAYRQALTQVPGSAALSKAVQNVGPYAASHASFEQDGVKPAFSNEISTKAVTNQKKSGRCWLFASLNIMRHATSEKYNIEDIEFSESYLAFYDRLEKANLFLENILATAAKPLDDRAVALFLSSPNGDGGYWESAAALVAKYGAVPKAIMPETFNSSNTAEINSVLNTKLRKDAGQLRAAFAKGNNEAQLAALKKKQLATIYRMLSYAYGTPPQTFTFEYRDRNGEFHRDANLTPKGFYDKYIGWQLDDYVDIVTTSAPGKQFYEVYSMPEESPVVGGQQIQMLNVPQNVLEELAIAQIKRGETVWFGNDVLQDMDRKSGTLQGGLYDLSSLFATDMTMDQGSRFATLQADLSHAMVFTGVDLVDGQARKWKVENSWGKANGHDGYFTADDKWFKNYVYDVIIKKDLLTPAIKTTLTKEPIPLKPWDPLI